MLKFLYCRPFGTEIELDSFDGVAITPTGRFPEGIQYVANLVSQTLEEYVEIRDYAPTHWYKTHGYWVVKPDNSCGIEVCSPVMQGWYGLKKICQTIDAFQNNSLITTSTNCSLHLHLDVNDLLEDEIGNILRWWIKVEPVFLDSVPDDRKNNKYCQFMGLFDKLHYDKKLSTTELIELFGLTKYHSMNSYHLWAGERNTLEYRIGEHFFCTNSYFTKNWVRLLIHFSEIAKEKAPDNLAWMDVKEVFDFLKFTNDLSPGMKQIRDWFLGRLFYNSSSCLDGFFKDTRDVTKKHIGELMKMFPDFDLKQSLYPPDYKEAVYDKIYSI